MNSETLTNSALGQNAALLLSLCIPTYQRAGFLEEGLDAALVQWADDLTPLQRRQVEVIICDNASTDGTPALVKKVQEANPSLALTYFRQPENRGADANILQAASLGTGQYLYLLSDDDILLPGALRAMLALIDSHPGMAAFCLNSRPFLKSPAEETVPVLPLNPDQPIESLEDCLYFLGTRLTFLSILLFRRDAFAAGEYSRFVGSNLLQSYVFVDALGRGGMFVPQRIFLATRENNTGGYNFFQVFVTGFGNVMRYARSQGCAETTIRAVLARHLAQFLLPFVAAFKLHGVHGGLQPDFKDGARRLLAEYGLSPVLIFCLLPLLLAPAHAVHGLRTGIRLVRGRSKGAA